MKKAKAVFTNEIFIGRKSCCMSERRKFFDEDHKDYVRSKRNHNNLPNSWDTKWINVRQFRNWKHRVKKRHQWEKHQQTPEEIKKVTGKFPEDYLLYIYGQDKWVGIKYWEKKDVKRLIEEGKLQGGYVTHTYWSTYKYDEETQSTIDVEPHKVSYADLEYAKLP